MVLTQWTVDSGGKYCVVAEKDRFWCGTTKRDFNWARFCFTPIFSVVINRTIFIFCTRSYTLNITLMPLTLSLSKLMHVPALQRISPFHALFSECLSGALLLSVLFP